MSDQPEQKVATIDFGEGKGFNPNADDEACCCGSKKETESAPKKTW